MKNTISPTKAKDITRNWHLVDAKDKIIGKVAAEIAPKLMGKGKTNYVRNLDCGDFVVVINCKDVKSTGKKETTKFYGKYSGYPGGLKQKALWQMRVEKPEEIIRHAVRGMLPVNKLRDRLITRLYVYTDDSHPYKDKIGA